MHLTFFAYFLLSGCDGLTEYVPGLQHTTHGNLSASNSRSRSKISEDGRAYTDREFALILSRAAELTGPSDAVGRPSAGFSLEEVKAIAAEAGLDPVLVERAARQIPVDSRVSWLQRVLGGSVRYRLDAHFRTELTDESAAHRWRPF